MKFRVGVFPLQGKKKMRYNAYTTWFNPKWKGCCLHTIEAKDGTEAKRKAIDEHKAHIAEGFEKP